MSVPTTNAEAASAAVNRSAGRRANRWNRRIRLSFLGSLKAELLKLKSLKSTWILLGLAAALMVGMAALSAWTITFMTTVDITTGKTLDHPKPLAAVDLWAVLASSGSTAALVIGIFGVMAITSEYTTSAIQSSLTANPRRIMFYTSKSLAVALYALASGIVGILLASGVLWLFVHGHDVTALKGDQWRIIPITVAGFPLIITLIALLAVGLGALTRSTVGGVSIVVVLLMVLSSILAIVSMAVSQVSWLGTLAYLTPDMSMNNFLGASIRSDAVSSVTSQQNYWIPEWWQSGLILCAWVTVAWIGGLTVTAKTDVK
ncbi:permease of ABC transporter system [Bifidobacterium olomucense]|uniref:Permease of ABC transporter system n=1 Tax=Bifidobacterium olomucense TaxID=2675324 RepID=A0A7Y0HY76_9BIFI|nr:permease of ABC transporter system [Bifidobacterium sp. DSM 109959]NMM99017.1 permease of ABC transporter system [Bifidobacterium sp. DSM 109959]